MGMHDDTRRRHEEAVEAAQFLRDVFPSRYMFETLVGEGAVGNETHSINGDDLAGACWALNNIMEYLGMEHV